MDVFRLRDALIADYTAYIKSFITIQDKYIRNHVEAELQKGVLWPDPLIQLNPNFQPGAWIEELVAQGALHAQAGQIFRLDKVKSPAGKPMRLHQHQSDAVMAARSGDNYVLTTGTGSGKSLAYIVPIVDHVLRRGRGRGIQAVIVYPMNALANSQMNELDKFLGHGFAGASPVTYKRYTGQEGEAERLEIINRPPDILLTNYVMLELIMTRPRERRLVDAMRGLQFLVLDELHTYRGRQGADVAMLARRVRDVCQNPALQCVGTSATLAEGGPFWAQRQKIAEVATKLFGAKVKAERVIGETLRRATKAQDVNTPAFIAQLTRRVADLQQEPPQEYGDFVNDPLSTWIETTFGLAVEEDTGRLKRAEPISITGEKGAGHKLAEVTDLPVTQCTQAIQVGLLAGYRVKDPETDLPVFAFRLHQFISRGDMVYASLEEPDTRYITLKGQKFVPGDRQKVLLPIAFCRECGQEYYVVSRVTDQMNKRSVFIPRQLRDQAGEDEERGFLYSNPANPWPDDLETLVAEERLPEDWLEPYKDGMRVKYSQRKKWPEAVTLNTAAEKASDGLLYHFVKTPFPFCLNCGVTYSGRELSDFAKLATLSSEGRSTSTTILSLAALRRLRRDEALTQTAKKLLSFTDNRQDASLQAGHFNDFIEVGLMRAALYRAVAEAGESGLQHDQLALKVFQALNLPFDLYASDLEGARNRSKRRLAEQALRDVLGYRVYQDLRRGWRITAPNLEQCGLLQIEYLDLPEICADDAVWAKCHPTLATSRPGERYRVAKVFLDVLRRGLAIRVDYLDSVYQEGMKQRSSQHLVVPWAIDEAERLTHDFIAVPGSVRYRSNREYVFVSPRSGFGLFLRRVGTFPGYKGPKLKLEDTQVIIQHLFDVLAGEGLLDRVEEPQDKEDFPGYQLNAAFMVWQAGDGQTPFHDPIRMPRLPGEGRAASRTNSFFVNHYQAIALELKGVEAREHTAQVPSEERQRREDAFRQATLPVLYCSPTMELGVDIAQLNVVNMRNVPPTPANYAQRSGRAGRSGQPALVFTYCTTGSPHDQYFFKRPAQMVAGSVRPPRLELANEDLIRAHVHAVWLAQTGEDLHDSLKDLLNLDGEPPSLAIRENVLEALQAPEARQRARQRLSRILDGIADELQEAAWYNEAWLQQTLSQAVHRFDEAGDRWRGLYRSALQQRDRQDEIVRSPVSSPAEKEQAKRLRAEAEAQLALLLDARDISYSDFYSYRYFASEGFLPGYNFPRLPLSAYIPGRRGRRHDDQDEFLSRPRFLAISEFGPRSIVYHEGSRYVINKAILPVSENGLLTTRAKVCQACGYLHPISDEANPDRCDYCDALLPGAMTTLFRMQNVATQRRDRINSDEEERVRMGYELQTSVRFTASNGRPAFSVASVKAGDGRDLLRLTYGGAATIWRVNKGWRRRQPDTPAGFVLDIERGYWQKSDQEMEADADDPMSARTQRVIPFVEDRRNCLLVEFAEVYDAPVMASLQPALKSAIQVLYQLEDNELSVEPLPAWKERRLILLYESAEGGAGVLRQLVSEPQAIQQVARKALELCHFDPNSREDLKRAPGASEDCEAACYDCLMSYTNQPDHRLLDRNLVKTPLYEVAHGVVNVSPTSLERDAHLEGLKAVCESDLEREWLDFLSQRNLLLPDVAQKVIEACHTRCDFYYSDRGVVIYVDGPHHDGLGATELDNETADCLVMDLGLTVLRFRYDNKEEWARICANHAYVFGKERA
jgi:ATP-dependent helicase YprA (DUF1998 family)/very-short-patch-repair endonuclease